jgi:translocation and assembly module TamA
VGKRLKFLHIFALLLAACAGHTPELAEDAGQNEPAEQVEEKEKTPGLPFQVVFEGVEDGELRGYLEALSNTKKQIEDPPASALSLKSLAKKDLPEFEKALRSRGYYDAVTTVRLDKKATPVAVVFEVNLGKPYRLSHLSIKLVPADTAFKPPEISTLGLDPGQPASTEPVLKGESKLLDDAKAQGFALAKLCDRKVVVDHRDQTMSVTYCLEPGPKTYLGRAIFIGAGDVKEDFLQTLIAWEPGELYSKELIDDTREKLIQTRLFVSARVELGDKLDPDGTLPVTFKLAARKPRTISASLRGTTDQEKFVVLGEWEHRNLWGRGENLEARLQVSFIRAFLEGIFRKPAFYHKDQSLLLSANLEAQNTDAFKSTSATAGAAVERTLTDDMLLSLGLAYRFSRVEDKTQFSNNENFSLLSIPMRFNWDYSDDAMDPNRGGRIWLDGEPFYDIGNASLFFYRQRIRLTHYFTVLEEPRLILAGRAVLGNIWGAGRGDVPADLRTYAGGGGSIRGYKFQSVSPRDPAGKIIGGRSVLELSGEVRWSVTESIGLVLFADAGRAYESTFPDFVRPLQIGAGPGVRYNTPIGPIRLDIGFPINKRSFDDSYQIYISIGQAF